MVPPCWLIEAMKMVRIADNIVNVFENTKETWITELIVCNESLGEVDIRRFFFTFVFCCCSYTLIDNFE